MREYELALCISVNLFFSSLSFQVKFFIGFKEKGKEHVYIKKMHAKAFSSYYRKISSLSVKNGTSLIFDEKKTLLFYICIIYFKEKKSNGLMWIWLCSKRYNLAFAHPCLVHPAKHEEKKHNRFDWIYRMFHHYKCKTTECDFFFAKYAWWFNRVYYGLSF